MGDHAFDIARVTVQLSNQPLIKPLVDIPRMAGLAQQMMSNALEAYTKLDIELAEKVCRADDEVDDLYQQVFRELLTYMMQDPHNYQSGRATDFCRALSGTYRRSCDQYSRVGYFPGNRATAEEEIEKESLRVPVRILFISGSNFNKTLTLP